jgi:hypothetical protein
MSVKKPKNKKVKQMADKPFGGKQPKPPKDPKDK